MASPPLWQLLLFEWPSPLVVVLALGGLLMLGRAFRAARPRLALLGAALLLLSPVPLLTARAVTTTRERLMSVTRALVGDACAGRGKAFRARVVKGAAVAGPEGRTWRTVEKALQRYEARRAEHPDVTCQIDALEAVAEGPQRGASRVRVEVQWPTGRGTTRPIHTKWRFQWQRAEKNADWRLAHAVWLAWQKRDPPVF